MSVAGYNHQDTEDCLGIEASEDRTVATVYIGQAYDTTEIELTADELHAFIEQATAILSDMDAKQARIGVARKR